MVQRGIIRKEDDRSDTMTSTESDTSSIMSTCDNSMTSPNESSRDTPSDDEDAITSQQQSKKIPRGSHACIICRRLKMRCVTEHHPPGGGLPTGPCVRCARLGNECVFQESRRGKRVRKDAKIEAMTKRMRLMEERIAELQRHSSHSASPPNMLSPAATPEVSQAFPMDSNPLPTAQHQQWNTIAARRQNKAMTIPHLEPGSAPTYVERDLVAEVQGLLGSIQQKSNESAAREIPNQTAHPQHHPYHFGPSGIQSPLHISTPPYAHPTCSPSHTMSSLPTPPDDVVSRGGVPASLTNDDIVSLSLSLPSPPHTDSHPTLLHNDAEDLFWDDDCFLSVNPKAGGPHGSAGATNGGLLHAGMSTSTTTTALNTPAIAPNGGFGFFPSAMVVSPSV